MFSVSTPEIDAFEAMYNAADKSVVLVAADSILNVNVVTGIKEGSANGFEAYPNPTVSGKVFLRGMNTKEISSIEVFNTTGKLVLAKANYPHDGIQLPSQVGIYFIRINQEKNNLIKVVRD